MFPTFLAEVAAAADFSAQALKDWLAVLFYLVGGATAIVALWKMLSGKNGATEIAGQPIEVKAHAAFATKLEHEQLQKKLDDELGRERGSRKKIHEEVATLQGDLKTLQRETTLQSG